MGKNADRIDMIIYDELDSGRFDDKDEGGK